MTYLTVPAPGVVNAFQVTVALVPEVVTVPIDGVPSVETDADPLPVPLAFQ
jgi:hypothetical protein